LPGESSVKASEATMNPGEQFGTQTPETIGNGITKLSDDVLVYINKGKLVIESRYNSLVRSIGCIPFLLFFLLSSIISIIPITIPITAFFIIVFSLSVILFVIATRFSKSLPKNTIDRVIIDNNIGSVKFERERGKKSKLKKQCSISSIKNVRVDVDDYDRMDIYLDSTTESFCIIGYRESIGNTEKLKLAHRIAEFLGVPVIERT
jgi:hypothetical protein